MKKKRCYYAHAMSIYNTTSEKTDVEMLEQMGFEVVNPNSEELIRGFEKYKKTHSPHETMEYFFNIISTCDILAFTAVEDFKITSGVAKEIEEAICMDIPVIELPWITEERYMSLPQTYNYLKSRGVYDKN